MTSVLGCNMMRVFTGGPNAFMAEEQHYNRAARYLAQCCDMAKPYGVKILIEIHNNSLAETAQEALKLHALVNRDNLGFIHDAGNMYITDTDYGLLSVQTLGNKMFHIHVKGEKRVAQGTKGCFSDITEKGREYFCHTLLKDSAADHKPLFDALNQTDYKGWVSLECHVAMPYDQKIAEDLRELKKLMNS
jgi:sugar phosphate isomerase/epimerase